MELASLSNRFSFFENYKEKEPNKPQKKHFRISPSRDGGEFEVKMVFLVLRNSIIYVGIWIYLYFRLDQMWRIRKRGVDT